MTQFFGKYRGKVLNPVDALFLGRVQVEVPALPGTGPKWCMPCVPYQGLGAGPKAIPAIGTNVWVEFEGGDVNFPIWTGCFWSEGQFPGK